ncbi:PREDICTED: ATP synthase subunit d, mitochondrial-like [Acropora digitifera]|uniref:ATP synthase subunit d, mitochondrial-like n=1 Tax=Acropora digitifera TaxID=70779 RepID=UPI00077AB791|nr:PREDICTED: ATP synthase subunit d, mitochondrial-like [Acropora digitifera]
MAARRIGQYVPDWIKIATKVPNEARPDMNSLRMQYESIKTSLDAVAAKPEPIDWDFYAKNISKPGLVEAFRKAEEHAVKTIKLANLEIAKYEVELQKIKSMKPFEEMTVDDYLELHPEIRKQAEEEIARNDWSH